MRNKGLVLIFTILLAVVCLYCLSFSFVTWNVEKKAHAYAMDETVQQEVKAAAKGDVMLEKHLIDSVTTQRESQYLMNMNDSSVFLGFTYKECKNRELNLGLDLKGGMNVTLEISIPDVVYSLATNNTDPFFTSVFEKAKEKYAATTNGDFIDIFVETFNAEKKAQGLENATLRTYFGQKANVKNADDGKIVEFLRTESNDIVDRSFKILRTRIDRFGVAQPNLQRLQGGRIMVELPGVKEPERVTDLLKSTAKLEFWEVYNDPVNGQSIQQRFLSADLKLAKELAAKKANGGEEDTSAAASAEDTLNTLALGNDAAIDEDEDDEEDEEDDVFYNVECPGCGFNLTVDESILAAGHFECPECGAVIDFDTADVEEVDFEDEDDEERG